ncbi:IS66 family insertion sequence element accessory protein TnpB [Cypionkella psychrotolerans]|uniref:IS66 family insertion sequence element accessory protein TnpB n=1 Tax=Cypionkella psychrotolerans TaxID=1678131 RepID=UPI003898ED1E
MPAGECIAFTERGTGFVFRSRRADRLKLLYWDGTGFGPSRRCMRRLLGNGWPTSGWRNTHSPGQRSRTG